MASNELAAILARRRAKEGGGDSATPAFASNSSTSSAEPTTNGNGAAAPPAPSKGGSSIADRIARLKAQSAAAGGAPMPTLVPIATNRPSHAPPAPAPIATETPAASTPWSSATTSWSSPASNEPQPAETMSPGGDSSSAATPAESPGASNRRTSNRIQQLQGSLGINVNPFGRGPPGGFRKPSGVHRVEEEESTERAIMTTGDQYAHMHGHMGIRMPGMGAAIPMPGLAKAGTRIPGMASDRETAETEEAAATASLESSHTTMSRVTGPKRRGPSRAPPGAIRLPGTAIPAIASTSESMEATAPVAAVAAAAVDPSEGLFGSPSTPASSSADLFGGQSTTPNASGPVASTVPAAALFQPAQPVATLVQPEPTPVLFSSAPSVTASISSLAISEPPTAKPVNVPSTPSLFGGGATLVEPTPTPAPITAPVAPVAAAAPAPSTIRRASLFGSGSAVNNDASSESDWSDDESSKPKPAATQGSLFGAPAPAPGRTPVPVPAPTPVPAAPAVSSASSSLFGGPDDHNDLFGGPSTPASATAIQPTPVTHSTSANSLFAPPPAAGAAAPIKPPQQFSSLFGADSDDDSDDSDDEGGLFGTGLPTSR